MSRAGQVGAEQRLDAEPSKVVGAGEDNSPLGRAQKVAPAPEGIAQKADNPSGLGALGHSSGKGGHEPHKDSGARKGGGAGKDADEINPKAEVGDYSAIRKEHQLK